MPRTTRFITLALSILVASPPGAPWTAMPPARSRPQSPFNRQALCEPLVGYSGQPRYWFWTTIYHFLVSDSGSVNYVRALPESTRIAAQKEIATLLGFDAEIDADWLRDQVSGRPLISVFGRFGETPDRRLCWIFFESIASGQGLKRRGSSGTWVYRIFRVYPDKTYDTLRMIRPTPAQPTLAEISNFVHLKEGTPYRTDWIFTWTDTGAAPVRDLSFETAIRIAAIGDTFELRTRTPHGKDILDAAMKVRNFPAPGFAKLRSYGEDFHVYVKVREVERSSRTNGGRGENRGYRTSWRTAADELRRMIFPFGPSERVRFTPDGSTFRELPWPIRNIPGIKPDSYAQANERSSWNHTSNWVNALASRDGTRLTAVVKLPHSSATDPALSIVEYLRNPKSGLLSDGHQIHSSRDPDDPQASEFFGPDLYYTTDNRITFMSQHVVRRGQTFHAQYRLYQRLGRDEIHYGSEIVHESGRIEGPVVLKYTFQAYSNWPEPLRHWVPRFTARGRVATPNLSWRFGGDGQQPVITLNETNADLELGIWFTDRRALVMRDGQIIPGTKTDRLRLLDPDLRFHFTSHGERLFIAQDDCQYTFESTHASGSFANGALRLLDFGVVRNGADFGKISVLILSLLTSSSQSAFSGRLRVAA